MPISAMQHSHTDFGTWTNFDNATFHKSNKITELAKGVGAEILYLPPYSPDFNKIEHHWFAIKNRIRNSIHIFSSCC